MESHQPFNVRMDSERYADRNTTSDMSDDHGSQPSPATSLDSCCHTSATPPFTSHLSDAAAKIIINLNNYLALGCLCFEDLHAAECRQEPNTWREITSLAILGYDAYVASDLHNLLRAGWIRMQSTSCSHRPQWVIARIYLLFQDVGMAEIDRSNKRLITALERLVQEVDTESRTWHGYYVSGNHRNFDPWARREEENPSLFHLFNNVASPSPNPTLVKERYDREALEDLLNPRYNVPGMKTTLYPYQRRSAGAMLQREAVSHLDLDPRLEQRVSPDGRCFYYAPRDFQFFREPKLWEAPRGGVLAESMGLGKTVICLSVILATKNHPPKMPKEYVSIPIRPKVGSLADMAVSATNRISIPWKVELERMKAYGQELTSCEDKLRGQPASYEIPGVRYRWTRTTVLPKPQHITMASTTLIVVPPNLIKQWKNEIDKHVEARAVKVLVVDDRKVLLPSANELRTFDIILFTRNRFDLEDQDGQDSEGRRMSKVPLICTCPYKGATRTRDCNCLNENDLYSSPLKELHFKRLIVDEGHYFSANNTSSTIRVAKNLVKVDHRWVVSGTPAKDLLGVEIDQASADSQDLSTQRKTFDSKHDVAGAVDSINALASNFLMSTPWKVNDAKNYIYRHTDFRNRTYSGFSVSFQRMLSSVVVKTRPEDVEVDIPPCTHEIKLLAPSYYDKLTANMFTLVLTANAVTSERTDADYLFHKGSAKARYQLISNLRQSAFFWSGFSEDDFEASVKNSTTYLAKESTGCSPQDRQLLLQVLDSTKTMNNCQGWRSISRSHELGVFVDDWPEDSAEHWAFDESKDPLLTGISQLLEAQTYVNHRLHLDDPGEGLSGAGIRSLASTRLTVPITAQSEHVTTTKARQKTEKPVLTKAGIPTSSLNGEPALKRKSSASHGGPTATRKMSATGYKVTKRRRVASPNDASTDSSPTAKRETTHMPSMLNNAPHLSDDSPYAWARVIGTTSSKLSYLLSQILEHHQAEKILVFYTGENAAYYISQFLELFNIKHDIYAKSLSAEKKARYVENFQEKEELRVLLMDVGQAAFGLNICAASRIYFVNPVCRPHLESQAIKRAHRIGQTRKVTVETLVLQGSIEEKMLDRSKAMTQTEHQDAKALEDDGGIRDIIQSATPLPVEEGEAEPGVAQMAPLSQPERLWCRAGWREEAVAKAPMRRRKRIVLNDVTDPDEGERVVIGDDDISHPQVQVQASRRSGLTAQQASETDSEVLPI